MSVLQEYEQIRKRIGEEKFKNIEKFLDTHKNYLLSDIYYTPKGWKHFIEWELKNEKDPIRKKKLKKEYLDWIDMAKKEKWDI